MNRQFLKDQMQIDKTCEKNVQVHQPSRKCKQNHSEVCTLHLEGYHAEIREKNAFEDMGGMVPSSTHLFLMPVFYYLDYSSFKDS